MFGKKGKADADQQSGWPGAENQQVIILPPDAVFTPSGVSFRDGNLARFVDFERFKLTPKLAKKMAEVEAAVKLNHFRWLAAGELRVQLAGDMLRLAEQMRELAGQYEDHPDPTLRAMSQQIYLQLAGEYSLVPGGAWRQLLSQYGVEFE